MSKTFKILSFNEWKDNSTYQIDKWFIDRKIQIEQWFAESLPDFEYDYFEWNDTSLATEEYIGCLYFNEPDIEYKLNFIIDDEAVLEGIVSEVNLNLTGYLKKDGSLLGSLDKTLQSEEIVSDLIIELVNEFKIENIDEEGNRKITNSIPVTDTAEDDTTGDVEEPTGEIQDTEDEEIPEA